jgi:hypothetical protein
MKKTTKKSTVKKENKPKIYSLCCNDKYGIYLGVVMDFVPETRVAKVAECSHVCEWHGREGGITSLAAYGICGPDENRSKIGAPAPGMTILTGIVNVFPCTDAAVEAMKAVMPRE